MSLIPYVAGLTVASCRLNIFIGSLGPSKLKHCGAYRQGPHGAQAALGMKWGQKDASHKASIALTNY